MLIWMVFAFAVALSHCWVLDVNQRHVAKKLTTNVTFNCYYDGSDNEEAKLAQITRIRLLKFKSGNKWTTVAKLSDFHPEISTTFSYQPKASGHAGNISSSFMSLHFSIATSDVIGQFICEIDGYDVDDELTAVKTDPVVITERGVSYEDLLDIIVKLRDEERGDHTTADLRLGLLEKAVRLLENQGKSRDAAITSLTNRLNLLSTDFLKVGDDLERRQKKILADLDVIKGGSRIQAQAWPEGVYSLLNTTSGCPGSNSFDWTKSNIRIMTQMGNNLDNTSFPTHLAEPVLESNGMYNYVHMRFCTKRVEVAGPAWPKGSYCVNDYSGVCPQNLHSSQLTIDRENIGNSDPVTDLPSVNSTIDVTTIEYCCRNDGDAEHPILLPAQNPFYLYRLGGKCQEVIGMDVSDEWIFLDTLETDDAISGKYQPDVTLRNIKLQLCYYTPIPIAV